MTRTAGKIKHQQAMNRTTWKDLADRIDNNRCEIERVHMYRYNKKEGMQYYCSYTNTPQTPGYKRWVNREEIQWDLIGDYNQR